MGIREVLPNESPFEVGFDAYVGVHRQTIPDCWTPNLMLGALDKGSFVPSVPTGDPILMGG